VISGSTATARRIGAPGGTADRTAGPVAKQERRDGTACVYDKDSQRIFSLHAKDGVFLDIIEHPIDFVRESEIPKITNEAATGMTSRTYYLLPLRGQSSSTQTRPAQARTQQNGQLLPCRVSPKIPHPR
jgi:hypothetical protein